MKALFQSMGSNFTYANAWRHLIKSGNSQSRVNLKKYLSEKYQGEVRLYSKGRSALTDALRISLGKNDAVAVCGFTCYSVVQAVRAAGCKPVFVDIDKDRLHFGGDNLKKSLKAKPKIRAVIVQNTLGIPADISSIEAVVKQNNLVLIEDLAHSVGVTYGDGRQAGTVGDFTMFSFGREKTIDLGGGGALVVRNNTFKLPKRSSKSTPLIGQLRSKLYPLIAWHARVLYNIILGKILLSVSYKLKLAVRSADGEVETSEELSSWQARGVLAAFEDLELECVRRRDILELYKSKLPVLSGQLQSGNTALRAVFYSENRQEILAEYRKNGWYFEDTWYDTPVGPKRFMKDIDYPAKDCPNAIWAANHVINLPTHRQVTIERAETIILVTQKVLS